MYRSWVAILPRKPVLYLDSNSITSNGKIFDVIFTLGWCGNAAAQKDDNWAVGFWLGRFPNAVGISLSYKLFVLV